MFLTIGLLFSKTGSQPPKATPTTLETMVITLRMLSPTLHA